MVFNGSIGGFQPFGIGSNPIIRSNYYQEENAMEIEQDEDGFWTVYSNAFDYMAYGKTQQEALDNFENGLYATIQVRIEWGKSPI